jgi:hypothetical protein
MISEWGVFGSDEHSGLGSSERHQAPCRVITIPARELGILALAEDYVSAAWGVKRANDQIGGRPPV